VAIVGAFRGRVVGVVAGVSGLWRYVVDGDRKGLGGELAAGVGRLDGDGVAGRGLIVELGGIGDGDDAARGIDREAAAGGVAGQQIGRAAGRQGAGVSGAAEQVARGGAS